MNLLTGLRDGGDGREERLMIQKRKYSLWKQTPGDKHV